MIREQIAETIKNEAYCGYEGKLLGRRDAANAILTLLCTEIEKMGLSEFEAFEAIYGKETADALLRLNWRTLLPNIAEVIDGLAQAQLQKILNKLKEGAE